MNIDDGVTFLILAGVCLYMVFVIDYKESLRNKICALAAALLCIMNIFSAFFAFRKQRNVVEQYSYPATEYSMSIETTTKDNQNDTTFIISKIK